MKWPYAALLFSYFLDCLYIMSNRKFMLIIGMFADEISQKIFKIAQASFWGYFSSPFPFLMMWAEFPEKLTV